MMLVTLCVVQGNRRAYTIAEYFHITKEVLFALGIDRKQKDRDINALL